MTKPKIVATIEARMTSSRLPGKVLKEALGQPLLKHLIDRLKKVPSLDAIVLATTINETDAPLVDLARREGILCFRGSEEDVMLRVIGAAESAKADVIVEITGDCPAIDPAIVEETIQTFLQSECDYCNNAEDFCGFPGGMDTQVFRLSTLKESASMTQDPLDHEHVTKHIRQNPKLFSAVHLRAPDHLKIPGLELTLDEPKDYDLIKKVFEHYGNSDFSLKDLTVLFKEQHPEWLTTNKDVGRKGYS